MRNIFEDDLNQKTLPLRSRTSRINRMKKALKILGILLVGFIGFLFWYDYTYSIDVIESESYNEESRAKSLLIASQGRAYKNAIVNNIVDEFKPLGIRISVVDVTKTEDIDPDEWDALAIIHTIEMWAPQEDAEAFLTEHYDPNKMLVFATSGDGTMHMEGIDGMTGASIMEDVNSKSSKLIAEINSIFEL